MPLHLTTGSDCVKPQDNPFHFIADHNQNEKWWPS